MCAVSIIKGKIKFSISAWEGTDEILWFLHATQSNIQMREKKTFKCIPLLIYSFNRVRERDLDWESVCHIHYRWTDLSNCPTGLLSILIVKKNQSKQKDKGSEWKPLAGTTDIKRRIWWWCGFSLFGAIIKRGSAHMLANTHSDRLDFSVCSCTAAVHITFQTCQSMNENAFLMTQNQPGLTLKPQGKKTYDQCCEYIFCVCLCVSKCSPVRGSNIFHCIAYCISTMKSQCENH